MASADSSTCLCSKCSGPLTFQPRINLDLDLNTCSQPKMRGMIPLCNEDLDDYDAEITRLQSQIVHVQAQRKRLIDYKTQIHFLLSSFHRFPNEVLCLIFESACVENVFEERPWPDTSPVITYLPALIISSVCTRWRSLALASPTLWSQIKLEIPSQLPLRFYKSTSNSLVEDFKWLIQLYLDRSIDTPLAISVESEEWDHNVSPALDLLLDHTYRWKSFAYTGEHGLLRRLIGFNQSFPILETVILDDFGPGDPITCFKDAPNMRSVRTGSPISDLPLAWNQLTSLDTQLPTKGKDLNLRRCSDLAVLKLRSIATASKPGITLLAKLESFTFVGLKKSTPPIGRYDRTPLPLENIFPSFTFPSLNELIILSEIHGPVLVWSQDAFSAFISRSACILTTLSLSKVEISDLNLIAALRLLPSLVKFNIDGLLDLGGWGLITTHFISSLNGSSTPPILPKLRYLYMKIHVTSFDDAVFIDMVSSRCQVATIGIDCLRSVVLHFSQRVVDEEVYKPLYQLYEMGMCVVITGQ